MAIIKCKMCGGDLILVEGQSVAECEYCGSVQTVPSADNEKKLALFERANRLRLACEFDKAAGVYETIVADFPEEAEAYWGLVLCKYGIEYVDDPATGKKVPTCHRTSFQSALDDADLKQAMNCADVVARKLYWEEISTIERLRKGIIEVSGREKPYDIFICYKETSENGGRTLDSVLAQDVHRELTEQGYRVFFSRITLEDKLGEAYEPYIFAALHSAKVMLVFGTCAEHFNAVWVRNEWSRFLQLIAAGEKKTLIPCYRDMNPYDMPKEFARLQSQDLSKVGALQDLLRGIEKVIPRHSGTAVVREGGSTETLLKRGIMALEDSDWKGADGFFEQVLNLDPECAEAYLGKALAELRYFSPQDMVNRRLAATETVSAETKLYFGNEDASNHLRNSIWKFTVPNYLPQTELEKLYIPKESYSTRLDARKRQMQEEEKFWDSHRWLSRAIRFGSARADDAKKQILKEMNLRVGKAQGEDEDNKARCAGSFTQWLKQTDEEVARLREQALRRREEDYLQADRDGQAAYAIEDLYKRAAELSRCAGVLTRCGDYKDSQEKALKYRRDGEAAGAEAARLSQEEKQRKLALEQEQEERRRQLIEKNQRESEERRRQFEQEEQQRRVQQEAAEEVARKKAAKWAAAHKRRKIILPLCIILAAVIAVYLYINGLPIRGEQTPVIWDDVAVRNSIAAGVRFDLGLRTDGTVILAGDNENGRSEVDNWTDIVSVCTGNKHAVGLKTDGTIMAAGDNDNKQCEVSDWTDMVAVDAGSWHTVGLKSDGTVVAAGKKSDGRCRVAGWFDIIAVSADGAHTVGLKADGTVVATGWNEDGQCDVSDWTDIVAVSAGYAHTVGLKVDGTVVATGDSNDGECDVSGWTDIVAVSAGTSHTVGLRADGTVVAVGNDGYGQCDVSSWTDIVAVSAGNRNTIGLKADGTVVSTDKDLSGWTGIKLPEN